MDRPSRPTPATPIVAYQGTSGAYSQIAAEQHFGAREIVCHNYPTFRAMLEAVDAGAADYGIQPIENTTAGSINEAYDLLSHMELHVVGEEVLRIEHCLLALEGAKLEEIKRVYSHPQGLAQCSEFLLKLKQQQGCESIAFANTAMSVECVKSEGDRTQAAVASELAGHIHGLSVLERDIMNQRDNFTRFVIVSKKPVIYPESIECKTSLFFTTRHEQGALVRCLSLLANAGLNLTKIESRPRPGTPFEYMFYVDFEGNEESAKVKAALADMQKHTVFFKSLGSYPRRTRNSEPPRIPTQPRK